jgi:hypothetical protein
VDGNLAVAKFVRGPEVVATMRHAEAEGPGAEDRTPASDLVALFEDQPGHSPKRNKVANWTRPPRGVACGETTTAEATKEGDVTKEGGAPLHVVSDDGARRTSIVVGRARRKSVLGTMLFGQSTAERDGIAALPSTDGGQTQAALAEARAARQRARTLRAARECEEIKQKLQDNSNKRPRSVLDPIAPVSVMMMLTQQKDA